MPSQRTNQTGITLGLLFALMHTAWLVLVATGTAGPVMRAIEQVHFVTVQHTILDISITTAITGILGAFIAGYIIGATTAIIWEKTGQML